MIDKNHNSGPWTHSPGPPPRRRLWLVVAGGLLLAAAVIYLLVRFPGAVAGREDRVSLVYSLVLLAVIGGSVALHWRAPRGHALRYAALWLGIGALLFLGYGLRHEAAWLGDRLLGELMPHQGRVAGSAVQVTADRSGHFVVEAQVDGERLQLLVDTGASDVVLSPADARRLGFDVDRLAYTRTYRTANGAVQGAPVRLGRIAIGPLQVTDVAASVNRAPMAQSLLGMSFLGRLSGYEVSAGRLTLYP